MAHLVGEIEFPPQNHPLFRPPHPVLARNGADAPPRRGYTSSLLLEQEDEMWYQNPLIGEALEHRIPFDSPDLDIVGQARPDEVSISIALDSESVNGGDAEQVLEEEVVSSGPTVPYIGMEFDTVNEAEKLYNNYALKIGFGIRIASSRNSTRRGIKQLIRKEFECVHARKAGTSDNTSVSDSISAATNEEEIGASNKKQAKEHMDMAATRKRNRMERHDCKAHMAVALREGRWRVIVLNVQHTHPLMQQVKQSRFYRSHRKIPLEDYEFLKTLHNRNIQTSHVMAILGDLHGGVWNLPYTKTDVANARTHLRKGLSWRDMAITVEYFQKIQSESPQFYYAMKLDENQVVRGLFWVDGRTRELYKQFKDCVFFDTTFCTNRYNMPFAPLVGINHHMHTILLGCALLLNETIETFKWVFETWMVAMNQEHPMSLMTDQDKAMKTAIEAILPNTKHRCCKWHVMRKAQEKLGRLFHTREGFSHDFYSSVNDSSTVDEFQSSWQQILKTYDLADNTHLKNMWSTRETWAPVYFKKDFFPFTSSTGRSEGLNALFKKLVHPQDSVWTFMKQYEYIQETRLDREDNAGFTGEAKKAPLWGIYNIELQARNFYTVGVFGRFQKLLSATTSLMINMAEEDEMLFFLVPTNVKNSKTHSVLVHQEDNSYVCSCNMFEMDGLLCHHILKVMVHLNVQEIPEKYLLERWSENAIVHQSNTSQHRQFGVPQTNTLRFNALCRKMAHLASDACFSEQTYKIVAGGVDHLASIVAESKKAGSGGEDEAQASNSNTFKNPPHSAKKGRPEEKHKRKKPGMEVQQGKRKNMVKKGKICCSYCKEDGHNVQTCKFLEFANQRDVNLAEKEKCQTELKL